MSERITNFTHASEAIDRLRADVQVTQDELVAHASDTVAQVETLRRQLEELADKTAKGLAHLAVAIVDTYRPSRWARARQWFRDNIYDGTPIFTEHTELDERPLGGWIV